jgi:type I restriction enzyme S subunit
VSERQWPVKPLEDVVEILDKFRVPVNSKERESRKGNIPYYGATGQTGWIDDYIFDEELVLLGEDGAPFLDHSKPSAYIIRGKAWVNNHAHVLRGKPGLNNRFLLHYLNQLNYTPYISGTTRAKLPQGPMKQIPIPIPPINYQLSLVEAIDTQLSRLDETVATLEAIQAKLKQARASILKAAVEGRLVETEAELEGTSADAISSAATLMTQISEHRNHKLKDVGKSIKPRKSIRSPLMPQDNEHLNPPGWARATVASLCWDSDYGTSAKCTYENQGCPVLRIPNIADGKLELVDIKRASESAELKSTSILQPGDFLFIRTNGSLDLIGRGCVIQNELKEETSFASYLIRLRLLGDGGLWQWFSFVWSSNIIRNSIRSACKSSAGQNNISLSTVKGFEIPIPPPGEIRRILHEVDRRFSVLDHVESTVQASLARCGLLRQAILKRAFEGRLVPAPPEPTTPDHAQQSP